MENRKRVLIVDSDEEVLIALEHLLEDEGIETVTTWSAHEALELLRSFGFDVLLMGDHLADLSSEQVLREIQSQGGGASILVMESGGGRAISGAKKFESLGAAATVRKREYGQLLRQISTIAAHRGAAQARIA